MKQFKGTIWNSFGCRVFNAATGVTVAGCETKAIADHVVRAHNCHYELKEAVIQARAAMPDRAFATKEAKPVIDMMNAAIAKATKQEN